MTGGDFNQTIKGGGSRPSTRESSRTKDLNGLSLEWVYGFNKDIYGGVISLDDDDRTGMLYISGHTAVIYDPETKSQKLLQGHCNPITSVCASEDRRWVATADTGDDSMIVVWDTHTATPIKIIYRPHDGGVAAMDMSPDAMYLVTLSQGEEQEMSIWEWTVDRDGALFTEPVVAKDVQTMVRFNPDDITQVISNGAKRVIFWDWGSDELKFYSPPISQREFKQTIGNFTVSAFIPDSTRAITATVDGEVVVWDESGVTDDGPKDASDKRAIKVVRLHEKVPITFIGNSGPYLVTGSHDGVVKFFDFHFRVLAWFENIKAGSISSISFSNTADYGEEDPVDFGHYFKCPDFLIATKDAVVVRLKSALFHEREPKEKIGDVLLNGQDAAIYGLAAHPNQPNFATTGYSGMLHVWDYEDHALLKVKVFDKLMARCCSYEPDGNLIAVGFTNGGLKVLDSVTLNENQSFRVSKDSVTHCQFSHDSTYLATADADNCIALFHWEEVRKFVVQDDGPPIEHKWNEWVYIGRNRAHSQRITDLRFGVSADNFPRLVSIADDRTMVEYDLPGSSVEFGVQVRSTTKIEQTSLPTCCLWHPKIEKEDLIITANTDYKLRLHHSDTSLCRKTVLGPTYGGALTQMELVCGTEKSRDCFMAYATAEKVVGLIKLPLDGNPNRSMGLIAHPGEVTGITVSNDGRYMFTCGGSDMSIMMWEIETSAIEATIALGGEGTDPFYSLIEGGKGGEFYEEAVDYFYYTQLRTQGEQTTANRKTSDYIVLDELPNLMNALGYYPSEWDKQQLANEVQYMEYADNGGQLKDKVTFEEVIKLYVNHRPVFGIGKDQIEQAFAELGAEPVTGFLDRDYLLKELQLSGEAFGLGAGELDQYLKMLIGDVRLDDLVDASLTSGQFAENVLGFEDFDEAGEEEGVYEGAEDETVGV